MKRLKPIPKFRSLTAERKFWGNACHHPIPGLVPSATRQFSEFEALNEVDLAAAAGIFAGAN